MSESPSIDVNTAAQADDPSLITVAFATTDGEHVNQHFGSAQRFIVYGLSPSASKLITQRTFEREAQDGNEDKLVTKLSWLRGCDVIVCAQVGQSAARQLLSAGTQPIAVDGRPEIGAVIAQLQSDIVEAKAAWLKRLLKTKKQATSEVDDLLDEEWTE